MSELDNITKRPAVESECRTIAELYRISSDGVAEYFWAKTANPGDDLLDVGQFYFCEPAAFSNDGTQLTWVCCLRRRALQTL